MCIRDSITAAGGRTFRLRIDGSPQNLWSIGIDLGHKRNHSRLCVTLLRPDGSLMKAWLGHQALNERATPDLLRAMLKEAHAAALNEDKTSSFLILRDGRWPAGSNPGSLLGPLRDRSTTIEVRKGGNPLIWCGSPALLPGPHFWGGFDNQSGLLFCSPDARQAGRRKGIGGRLKITWDTNLNQLALNRHQIARLVLGSRFAPTLGAKPPLLPAALYWADGIAGATETDLRFRGQQVTPVTQ